MGSLPFRKAVLLFFVPALAVYGMFFMLPFFRTIVLSLYRWNGMGAREPVGLRNFVELATDRMFLDGIGRIVLWAIMAVVLKVGAGLVLAAMLRIPRRGSKILTAVFFLPYVISSAAIGLMFTLMYDLDIGIFNKILRAVGLGQLARAWLGDPRTAMIAVILVPIWHAIGYFFVILVAAIHDTPDDVYDAALIDGSGGLSTFWRITIPMIWPVLQVCIILAVTTAFKSFDYVFIMTRGGPGTSTQVPATYMYTQIFVGLKFGYGMAISLAIFAMCLVFTVGFRALTRMRMDA